MTTLSQATIDKLIKLAQQEPTENDDLFGENPDDAYQYGLTDGEADMARMILTELGIKY